MAVRVVLLVVGTVTALARPSAQESPLNAGVAKSPSECRNGTATIELVKEWLGRELSYLPGPPAWVVKEQDLDLDGTPDLLIADPRLGGSGGQSYSAFLRTPRGLRFIGGFLGSVRALPSAQGRIVIATSSGSGSARLQLAEIRPDGLHRLAVATLSAGDSGTEEGNRLYQELMMADTVSEETLRSVFGGA